MRPAGRSLAHAGVLTLAFAALPLAAFPQGVPIVDGKALVQHVLEIAQMTTLTGARALEADKKRRIDALHQEQLDALEARDAAPSP